MEIAFPITVFSLHLLSQRKTLFLNVTLQAVDEALGAAGLI